MSVVCPAGFTDPARTFAADKPMELVDIGGLLEWEQRAQAREAKEQA